MKGECSKYRYFSDFTRNGVYVRCNARQQQAVSKSAFDNRFFIRRQSVQTTSSEIYKAALTTEGQDTPIETPSPFLPASKSELLIASLGPSGKYYFVSGSSKKVDFTFVGPRSIAKQRDKLFIKRGRVALEHLDVLRIVSSRKKSLISFLSLYITYLDPIEEAPEEDFYAWASDQTLRQGVLEAFDDVNLAWLRTRGYDISDLAAWRWILSARLSEVAVARLTVLADSQKYGFQAGRIPVFLIVFLLRRRHFNDRALCMMLTLIWNRLLEQDAFEQNVQSDETAEMSSTEVCTQFDKHLFINRGSIMIMIVRLLRRAREVWPAALPSISRIATRYLGRASTGKNLQPDYEHRRWAFLFNSVLRLLALPSSRHPFRSIIFHERAQFNIVRKMAEFEPALNINRKGYQAVVQVQLARRKTSPEREWARLKAKSWPPWKESKMGIDSDIGIERGVSRALEAITRSQEAGYAEQDWDSIAKIYAGWDTDNSPTIQTRVLGSRVDSSWRSLDFSDKVNGDAKVWSARITATRTVSEAWACFLAYRDKQNQTEGGYSQWPYFAMFEKIIFEEKKGHRSQMNTINQQSEILKGDEYDLLPGDGKETWSNPDPQKTVYTRIPVPRPDEFLKSMTEDRVVPGGRFLEFLVQEATSIHEGAKHLAASNLSLATRISFFNGITFAEMCGMSLNIFSAYINCLCRYCSGPSDSDIHARRSTIFHAFQLMNKRQPCYWPPWNSLMTALRSEGAVVDYRLYSRNTLVQDALAWSVMLDWLDKMRNVGLDVQFDCFQSLCIGLEKSTIASRKLVRILDRGAFVDDGGLEPSTPAGQKLQQVLEQNSSLGVEKSTLAGWKLLRDLHFLDFRPPGAPHHSNAPKLLRIRPRNLARIRHNAEYVVSNGPEILKACFEELVGVTTDLSPAAAPEVKGEEGGKSDFYSLTLMPKLLAVPHPTRLHAFIRVLGLHQDYEGILKVVQWMNRYADEIYHQMGQDMNGETAMRRVMTAVRVFFEGGWPLDDDPVNDGFSGQAEEVAKAAPTEIFDKVFEIIDRQEFWGGWASDEEVEFYIANSRRSPNYSDDSRRIEETLLHAYSKVRMKGFRKVRK